MDASRRTVRAASFFSFNYPPLIRHYGRNGSLISEFKPESDIAIEPPNVSVRKQGNSTVVRARMVGLVASHFIC